MVKKVLGVLEMTKLLSQNDLDEVEKFRQYLGDLHSAMPREEFVNKWREYMFLDELAAAAYVRKLTSSP